MKVPLRISQREKRPAISSDYEVYLNEYDYNIGFDSYDQANKGENFTS